MQVKDYVFFPLLIGACIIMMVMFLKVFRLSEEMFTHYPEYEAPKASDFKWGILAAIVIHILKKVAVKCFFPFYYKVIEPKY